MSIGVLMDNLLPFLNKKYKIIYVDPMWEYNNKGTRASADKHYSTMTISELKKLPVNPTSGGGIAAEDCVLFMWATFPMLQEALDLIKAWGFTYKTIAFNWVKQNKSGSGLFWGLGNYTRGSSEICLLATKGKIKRVNAAVHSVIISPIQVHSQKPDKVRERIVELMGDIPRIELFARKKVDGWDCWGDQIS
ncbi:MAG: DNA methyltransferase [Oscillospiraceae bacterium]|nr:DNA methyltransferase [Oscillospiraceae bacterium]